MNWRQWRPRTSRTPASCSCGWWGVCTCLRLVLCTCKFQVCRDWYVVRVMNTISEHWNVVSNENFAKPTYYPAILSFPTSLCPLFSLSLSLFHCYCLTLTGLYGPNGITPVYNVVPKESGNLFTSVYMVFVVAMSLLYWYNTNCLLTLTSSFTEPFYGQFACTYILNVEHVFNYM